MVDRSAAAPQVVDAVVLGRKLVVVVVVVALLGKIV
jgi:hypothetical protein